MLIVQIELGKDRKAHLGQCGYDLAAETVKKRKETVNKGMKKKLKGTNLNI